MLYSIGNISIFLAYYIGILNRQGPSLQVYGCAGVRVYGCAGVRVYGCAGLQVCGCTGVRVCRFAGLQVCRFAGLQVCGCAGVRVCGCAGVRVCGFAGVRVCGCAGVRVCGSGSEVKSFRSASEGQGQELSPGKYSGKRGTYSSGCFSPMARMSPIPVMKKMSPRTAKMIDDRTS